MVMGRRNEEEKKGGKKERLVMRREGFVFLNEWSRLSIKMNVHMVL